MKCLAFIYLCFLKVNKCQSSLFNKYYILVNYGICIWYDSFLIAYGLPWLKGSLWIILRSRFYYHWSCKNKIIIIIRESERERDQEAYLNNDVRGREFELPFFFLKKNRYHPIKIVGGEIYEYFLKSKL